MAAFKGKSFRKAAPASKVSHTRKAVSAPAPAAARRSYRQEAPLPAPQAEPEYDTREEQEFPGDDPRSGAPAEERGRGQAYSRPQYQSSAPREAEAPRGKYIPRGQQDRQQSQSRGDGEFRIVTPLYHSAKSVTAFLNDKPYGRKAPNYDRIMKFLTAMIPGDMIGVKDDGEKAYLYIIYNGGTAPDKDER